jgi:hypothetical protein
MVKKIQTKWKYRFEPQRKGSRAALNNKLSDNEKAQIANVLESS